MCDRYLSMHRAHVPLDLSLKVASLTTELLAVKKQLTEALSSASSTRPSARGAKSSSGAIASYVGYAHYD